MAVPTLAEEASAANFKFKITNSYLRDNKFIIIEYKRIRVDNNAPNMSSVNMPPGGGGMFGTLVPNNPGDGGEQKALRSCATCKSQKRKCDKALPACGLCERMHRTCDYTVSNPMPIQQEVNTLREQQTRMAGTLSSLQDQVTYRLRDPPMAITVPNAFPSLVFLDNLRFQDDGTQVTRYNFQLPDEIYGIFGNGSHMQAIIVDFAANGHQYFPITNKYKLGALSANELWNGGPETFCLCLSMLVLASKPAHGLLPAHHELYLAFKRLLPIIEASGTLSIMVLQANILVNLYEFGHAIYPAAMMSAALSVQYSSLLGINGANPTQMIGPPTSPYDDEERRRTFWGVMIMDRIIAAAGNKAMLTYHQFPQGYSTLPISDTLWDNGEIRPATAMTDTNIETATHFQRLCVSVTVLGNVVNHLQQPGSASDITKVQQVNELYLKMNDMCSKWTDENLNPKHYLLAASASAIISTAFFKFFNMHLRAPSSPSADAVRVIFNDGILSMAAERIVKFAKLIGSAATSNNSGDVVSPFIMDALYQAAVYYASSLRARPNRTMETNFDDLQCLLARLGGRWRCAADYDRFLEAKNLI